MKNKSRTGDAAYELRYEERDDYFKVDGWPIGDIEAIPSERGPLSERPEWLDNIITLAKIGGHANAVKYPPPNIIVWFIMDADYNLIEFVDMTPARQMIAYAIKPTRSPPISNRTKS